MAAAASACLPLDNVHAMCFTSSHYITASQKCCIGMITANLVHFSGFSWLGKPPTFHDANLHGATLQNACSEMGMLCRSYMSTWHIIYVVVVVSGI